MRRAATQGLVQDAWEREDEWLRERLKNHRKRLSTEMQRRADDRWILINERKTEDGSTVAVYSDITRSSSRSRRYRSSRGRWSGSPTSWRNISRRKSTPPFSRGAIVAISPAAARS